jgi:hypothetical protein
MAEMGHGLALLPATRKARFGSRLCENTGVQSSLRKSFLDFVSLNPRFRQSKDEYRCGRYQKRAIEETILRLVGS